MKKEIELLAPGGDVDAIKAAILAGANAVYCGLDKFNARNRAANISFENLQGILHLAHQYECEMFLTLNVIVVEAEIPALVKLLNKLVNTSIDGVIVQDLGMLYLLKTYFPSLKVHASTQLTTHNQGQIAFLRMLNVTRVNLSRELNIHEITDLTAYSHSLDVLTEVFVHGSNCISFSGLCFMSSVHGGNSGNRGRCSQPCRDQYETTTMGKSYPLNLKDNSAFHDLPALHQAGVDSLKIEGRIKKSDYVYTVVSTWRTHLSNFYSNSAKQTNNNALHKVFNRDFSNAFLKGNIDKAMFIDSPRDHSIKRLQNNSLLNKESLVVQELSLLKEKDEIKLAVERKVQQVSIDKIPLQLTLSGKEGYPLKVEVKTPDQTFDISSGLNLSSHGNEALDQNVLLKRLKAINDTVYFIEQMDLNDLSDNSFISFKELTVIKQKILFQLNGERTAIAPITLATIKKTNKESVKPSLSVLISSFSAMDWAKKHRGEIYFQLPNSIGEQFEHLVELFEMHPQVIPYFPAVLIGENYSSSLKLLEQIQAPMIVANNTGIAHYAFENNIPWIAGPELNLCNSYSLQCLKEYLNCSGAFISNELSEVQVKRIVKPHNFKFYYSVYHPIKLMTTRQCLFHQVTGCSKHKIDNSCISKCEKNASITNLKKDLFVIEKSEGNYHHLYNGENYLNTAIISKPSNEFDNYLVDLRTVDTQTKINHDNPSVMEFFEGLVSGVIPVEDELRKAIHPTTNIQYEKGI